MVLLLLGHDLNHLKKRIKKNHEVLLYVPNTNSLDFVVLSEVKILKNFPSQVYVNLISPTANAFIYSGTILFFFFFFRKS